MFGFHSSVCAQTDPSWLRSDCLPVCVRPDAVYFWVGVRGCLAAVDMHQLVRLMKMTCVRTQPDACSGLRLCVCQPSARVMWLRPSLGCLLAASLCHECHACSSASHILSHAGGIMKCDVIAAGIVNAAKQVNIKVPLIVRLEVSSGQAHAPHHVSACPVLRTLRYHASALLATLGLCSVQCCPKAD